MDKHKTETEVYIGPGIVKIHKKTFNSYAELSKWKSLILSKVVITELPSLFCHFIDILARCISS
jgi:hypothetical protein